MSPAKVSHTERADFYDTEHAAKLGRLLPPASAKALEKVLLINPNDVLNRARLLGHYWQYYEKAQLSPREFDSNRCKNRARHILWFIENAPDCIFAGDYYLSCDRKRDKDHYDQVTQAWKKQLKSRPACSQSRINFALFLLHAEPAAAMDLLLEVQRTEPLNEWVLALLPMLRHSNEKSPTLPLFTSEQPIPKNEIEQRLSTAEQMLSHWTSTRSNASRATVNTQERILQQDHCDIWARLDILRWCQKNFQRANHLGFDPAVAQRWFRHAWWTLHNVPQVNLLVNYNLDFGFGIKLPINYFDPIKNAFLVTFHESQNKVNVFNNAMGFFVANLGLEETKKLLFSLESWKEIDTKNRQKLTKELNRETKRKTIFEKDICLDSTSINIEIDVEPLRLPAQLSMWADDLDLSHAHFVGGNYASDCAANLEEAVRKLGFDLISTARLAGFYSRHPESLTARQQLRFQQIIEWVIRNIPESDYAGELGFYEQVSDDEISPLRTAWQKQINESPRNFLVAANAARWLSHRYPITAKQIAESILAFDPDNITAIGLIHGLSTELRDFDHQLEFRDLCYEATCEKRILSYVPSANEALAKLCDEIGLYLYSLLDCLPIPIATLWSNEQALRLNPNDVILRCEVLGWCDRHQLRRSAFIMCDPELARIRTEQILWLLENVPHADLHFFTRFHKTLGMPSHEMVTAKMVKIQRKNYGKTIAKYRPQFPHKKKKSKTDP